MMMPRPRTCRAPFLLVLLAPMLFGPLAGCGDDQEPEEAARLYEDLRIAERGYGTWSSPGPFADKQPSVTLHGGEVRIFMNSFTEFKYESPGPDQMRVQTDERLHQDCQAYADAHPEVFAEPYFAIDSGETVWPDGATLVKEGYNGAELVIVAVMEKRGEDWFFAEYTGDGEVLFSGQPEVCVDCHSGSMHDFVFSAHLSQLCRTEDLQPPPAAP